LNFKNKVIEKIAKEKKSEIIFSKKKVKTNLLWKFQEKNAWLAYEIAKKLNINEESIFLWLNKVKHRWRLDFIKSNLLVDWSHNIDWLRELKKYINKNLKDKFSKIIYCFTLKKWKKLDLVMSIFWKNKSYILIDTNSDILLNVKQYKKEFLVKNKKYILKQSQKNKNFLYVVFWSLYMIWVFLKK
jgi:hypothetical protein